MIQPLNVELAQRVGVRTALVAQCLWDLTLGRCSADTARFDGRTWLRMSGPMLTTLMPYMTRHTAATELRRLMRLGIICSKVLNDNPFDHTRSYSFTEYGHELMLTTEVFGDDE